MIVTTNVVDVYIYIWMAMNVTIFSYLTTQSKLIISNERRRRIETRDDELII